MDGAVRRQLVNKYTAPEFPNQDSSGRNRLVSATKTPPLIIATFSWNRNICLIHIIA
jgi:hypothetical protein